jgi:hypothetical protein
VAILGTKLDAKPLTKFQEKREDKKFILGIPLFLLLRTNFVNLADGRKQMTRAGSCKATQTLYLK